MDLSSEDSIDVHPLIETFLSSRLLASLSIWRTIVSAPAAQYLFIPNGALNNYAALANHTQNRTIKQSDQY